MNSQQGCKCVSVIYQCGGSDTLLSGLRQLAVAVGWLLPSATNMELAVTGPYQPSQIIGDWMMHWSRASNVLATCAPGLRSMLLHDMHAPEGAQRHLASLGEIALGWHAAMLKWHAARLWDWMQPCTSSAGDMPLELNDENKFHVKCHTWTLWGSMQGSIG